MNFDIFPALTLFAFVSSATPGPNNLMLMASGANFGFARSIPHMVGISIGFIVMMVLTGAGLVQIFDRYPVSYLVLKVLSVACGWPGKLPMPRRSGNARRAARQ